VGPDPNTLEEDMPAFPSDLHTHPTFGFEEKRTLYSLACRPRNVRMLLV
jgi:hypothetical protein